MNPYLVIIPTYNEIENIDAMIHRVMGLEKKIDLLIVDDNSPDGTAEVVKSLQNTYPNQLPVGVHVKMSCDLLGVRGTIKGKALI